MTAPVDRLTAALADRYAIEREIGIGGMATVYLARDLKHDRLVALKLLRPELGAVIGADRFLAEIKLTANLQHPHILPLFDSGAVDGLLFYVMPYVEGVSVRERLNREKQLSIAESVRIATEVASALDYAHRRNVIHRDIKPENILLHDGQALVADFGIALAVSTAGTRMTETGMSLGTPHYMSPEQAMGEREITARSDVYALGAVTYEMLVGEPPFTGPTAQSIVAKVLTEQPRPLLPKRHTIPRHVELAVLTALEKLPADRFATAAEFSNALNNPGATTAGTRAIVGAQSSRTGWRHPALVPAAMALAALGAGFAAGRVTAPADASSTVSRFVVSTPADHRLAGTGFTVVALSPDGSTLVYVGQSSRGFQLYRRRVDELTATAIPGTEGALAALYSADGRWISYVTGAAGLKKIPAEGGAVVPIRAGNLFPQGGVWLDGERIAVTALDGALHVVDAEGNSTPIASPDTSAGEAALIVTDAVDNGRAVLVVAAPGASVSGRAYLIDVKSGKRRLVVNQIVNAVAYSNGYVCWVAQDGTLLGAPFDLGGSEPAGAPVTLAQQVRLSVGGPPQFAVSQSGAIVYVPQMPFDLMLVDRTGRAEPAADVQRRFHSPRISPDGSRIAVDFTMQGSRDVWTLDLRDRTLTRLTFDNDGHDPVWDLTGRRIGYATARSGIIGMFLRNADGSGKSDSVHVGTTAQTIGAFLPSAQRILSIVTGEAGSFDLAFTPLSGNRKEQVFLGTDFNEGYPAVSPDGRWLAYVSDESGQNEVYVRPLEGEGAKILVSQNGGSEPVWARNGRELYYRGFGMQGTPLVAVTLQTTPSFRVVARNELFDVSAYESAIPHANYDVGPDGRFAMVHQGNLSEMVIIQNWTEEVRRRGAASK
ncbi:MAG: protein kinase domain-containing protein [Gemmatimonadaceae bacterium]